MLGNKCSEEAQISKARKNQHNIKTMSAQRCCSNRLWCPSIGVQIRVEVAMMGQMPWPKIVVTHDDIPTNKMNQDCPNPIIPSGIM